METTERKIAAAGNIPNKPCVYLFSEPDKEILRGDGTGLVRSGTLRLLLEKNFGKDVLDGGNRFSEPDKEILRGDGTGLVRSGTLRLLLEKNFGKDVLK